MILIVWSVQPVDEIADLALPPGNPVIAYARISLWMFGHLSGTFEVTGIHDVMFLVLDESRFHLLSSWDDYTWDHTTMEVVDSLSMAFVTGRSGSFSVDLTSISSYYMVVIPRWGTGTSGLSVAIHYKVEGAFLPYLIVGPLALTSGIVLLIAALNHKNWEDAGKQAKREAEEEARKNREKEKEGV